MRLILIQLIWLMVGCLAEPAPETAQSFGFPGSVSGRPSVLCGTGRGVIGVDGSGTVICGSAKLDGQIAFRDINGVASCAQDQTLRTVVLSSGPGSLEVSLCDDVVPSNIDDITLGTPPADAFQCPAGSALKGFSTSGEPICTQLVSVALIGKPYVLDSAECPWGLTSGQFITGSMTLPLCRLDGPNYLKQIKIVDARVAKFSYQMGAECPLGYMVVGFDANRQILCGTLPANLQRMPRRYLTTSFGMSSEDPICSTGYVPEATYFQTSDGGNVKVWTCK